MPSSRLAVVLALLIAPLPAHSAEFWLVAKPTTLMADGVEIPMWGFARASREQFGRLLAGEPVELAATVPGPALRVPAGDRNVTIHLLNQLPQPVSVTLHGRDEAKPVETATGTLHTYRWTGINPGSLLYESGTDPAFQVQMGLYGPMVADGPLGPLPAGRQFAVVFGEIDPAFHLTVGKGQSPSSALDYKGAFHYAEPMALDGSELPGKDIATLQGEPVLLRLFNAGLRTHEPVVSGNLLSVLAADGNPLPFPTSERVVALPPGGTRDVLFLPSEPGRYPLIDQGAQSGTFLAVEPSGAPMALADSYHVTGGSLKVELDKGVLANDNPVKDAQGELKAVLVTPPAQAEAFTLNPDGTFSYKPRADFAGSDSFQYVAVHDKAASGLAAATLSVAGQPKPTAAELKSPEARDHTFTLTRKQARAGAALDLLAHAKTPNAGAKLDPATIMVTRPAKGGTLVVDRATGAVSYRAPAGAVAGDSFLFAVKDTAGRTSNAATITINVAP